MAKTKRVRQGSLALRGTSSEHGRRRNKAFQESVERSVLAEKYIAAGDCNTAFSYLIAAQRVWGGGLTEASHTTDAADQSPGRLTKHRRGKIEYAIRDFRKRCIIKIVKSKLW